MTTIAPTHTGIPEEWWAAIEPPEGHRIEIIQGELVLSPSPVPVHVVLQMRLYDQLKPYLPDGYIALPNLEWRLAERGLVAAAPQPDLMVVRDPTDLSVVTEPPLLTVEVFSPSDLGTLSDGEHTRETGKRIDYATNGVGDHLEVAAHGGLGVTVGRFEAVDGDMVLRESVTSASGRVLRASRPFPYEIDPSLLV